MGDVVPKSGETLATSVFERLRRDIVIGVWPADTKLRIEVLCERYGAGATPIREALNRLTAERLVVQVEQRGFRVAPMSREDLLELTRTRIWIDGVGLRESIAHGDVGWEEGMALALHRLTRIPALDPGGGGLSMEWERRHRDYHAALISACRSRWLTDFSDTLFDCFGRYRYISTLQPPSARHVHDEHSALVETALSRDADKAVTLLAAHYQATAELVLEAW